MKVVGGHDVVTAEFIVGFRDGHGDYPTHGGKVTPAGYIEYAPVNFRELGNVDAKVTLRLSLDEAKALCELLVKHGFEPPKPPVIDDLPPTKAHLADAVAVRDRVISMLERKL